MVLLLAPPDEPIVGNITEASGLGLVSEPAQAETANASEAQIKNRVRIILRNLLLV